MKGRAVMRMPYVFRDPWGFTWHFVGGLLAILVCYAVLMASPFGPLVQSILEWMWYGVKLIFGLAKDASDSGGFRLPPPPA